MCSLWEHTETSSSSLGTYRRHTLLFCHQIVGIPDVKCRGGPISYPLGFPTSAHVDPMLSSLVDHMSAIGPRMSDSTVGLVAPVARYVVLVVGFPVPVPLVVPEVLPLPFPVDVPAIGL